MRPHAAALAALFTLLACAQGLPPIASAPAPPREPPSPEATVPDSENAPAPLAVPPPTAETTPAPAPPAEPPRIPGRVRVGLATDLPALRLPCCETPLALEAGARRLDLRTGARIEPAVTVTADPVFWLQAAALRSETQAQALARNLEKLVGASSEVVFDAGDGLYRVRLGRYPDRAEAEKDALGLRHHGIVDAWVVSEQPRLVDPALQVTHGGRRWMVPGRWLAIMTPTGTGGGIPLGGKRYRGELLVYLNDRGLLNLINRLTLDDYLRGVVPREMGPEVYDDLEALKAQAVAARTYTLRNMGEFRSEGYDICATPRCQVYGGIDSEHALSDRAVRETSGEVLMARGRFADALYSSTCGGHTENVEVVFPSKRHSYLRGVPCLEGGPVRLEGEAPAALIEAAVLDRLLPGTVAEDAAGFGRGARRLAAMAGLEAQARAPRSLERREIHAFLGRLLELEPAAANAAANRTPARAASSSPGRGEEEPWLAARLHDSGLMEKRPSRTVGSAELRRVLFRLAIYLRLLETVDGRYLSLEDGLLRIKGRVGERSWRVGADVATFRFARGVKRPAPLTLVAGDAVSAYAAGQRLLVLEQRRELDGAGLDRPSRYRSWQHLRTDRELERMVNSHYPGLGFRHLEIVSRGVSGRVATLRLTGRDGKRVDVSGLPIRWLLDLPDTQFTVERTVSRGGERAWLFSGSGWGHGVGMCQVGAFGMARRGHRYDDILDHYYTGLELRKLGRAPVRRSAL